MFAPAQLATVVPDAHPALAAHLDDPHLWHFDWGGTRACLLSAQSKTGGVYRGGPLHAEPLSRINRLTPRKLAGASSLNLRLTGCDCQEEQSMRMQTLPEWQLRGAAAAAATTVRSSNNSAIV